MNCGFECIWVSYTQDARLFAGGKVRSGSRDLELMKDYKALTAGWDYQG